MDKVFETWLQHQYTDALALCAGSDVLTLTAEPGPRPPRRFIARFHCPTMVKAGGEVKRVDRFTAPFQFPPDYLRSATDPAQLVNLFEPANAFHPNVAWPVICIGHVAPGTGLSELILQVHAVMTFNKLTPHENDALNRDACAWARRHMHLFPLSKAPLRRRHVDFSIAEIPGSEASHEPC